MNVFLISVQLCIIGCKIVYINPPINVNVWSLDKTTQARHKFGVDVWTRIIRQAVERLTEKEIFLPIIQKGYEYITYKGGDISRFTNFMDKSLNNYLSGALKINSQKLLCAEDIFTKNFKPLVSNSLIPLKWSEFQFTSSIIKEWHNSGPIEHYQQFQRLCIVEEILFKKNQTL